MRSPSATLHSNNSPSLAPVATACPPSVKSTDRTDSTWPVKVSMQSPSAVLHRRAERSSDPVATRMLSALNATHRTALVCPLKSNSQSPERTAQSRATLSLQAVAARRPSREKATPQTQPCQLLLARAIRHTPQPRSVVEGTRKQVPPTRGVGHGPNGTGVPSELLQEHTLLKAPQLHTALPSGHGEHVALRRAAGCADLLLVVLIDAEGAEDLCLSHAPDAHGRILAAARHGAAVGREGHGVDAALMAPYHQTAGARPAAPDPGGAVVRGGCH
mmetsp:Transcript_91508/g.290151  ORF Transcript_91508/g.290151 Transcript_91508/m.290151 type:complete len:274 (-) Transcript_91508:1118-1939(-)